MREAFRARAWGKIAARGRRIWFKLLHMLSLLQQPGPKQFKLFEKGLMYKAKKFKVLL